MTRVAFEVPRPLAFVVLAGSALIVCTHAPEGLCRGRARWSKTDQQGQKPTFLASPVETLVTNDVSRPGPPGAVSCRILTHWTTSQISSKMACADDRGMVLVHTRRPGVESRAAQPRRPPEGMHPAPAQRRPNDASGRIFILFISTTSHLDFKNRRASRPAHTKIKGTLITGRHVRDRVVGHLLEDRVSTSRTTSSASTSAEEVMGGALKAHRHHPGAGRAGRADERPVPGGPHVAFASAAELLDNLSKVQQPAQGRSST